MINVKGNAWDVMKEYDALCITTNGTIKKDGSCVMGRGIAREARDRYPGIDKELGKSIARYGNISRKLGNVGKVNIVSYVVKHNWWEDADIDLIVSSAHQIISLADKHNWSKVLMPRPGCGNGNLKWKDVEPILSEIFDDRFYVITF